MENNQPALWVRSIAPDIDSGFDTKWLLKPHNVTLELEKRYGNIKLEIICQKHRDLENYERELIGSENNFVREIYLKNNETYLTYGRVIFSDRAYEKLEHDISSLGEKPIGSNLFYKYNYSRSSFEYRKLKNNDPLFANAVLGLKDIPSFAYARRSIFTPPDDSKSIISLQEVFFPWLKEYDA